VSGGGGDDDDGDDGGGSGGGGDDDDAHACKLLYGFVEHFPGGVDLLLP
jgi:hypothetical protein